MTKPKIDQDTFDSIKRALKNWESSALESTSKIYKVSETTVKRIKAADTFPAYKIALRQTHQRTGDWLLDRGYEDKHPRWVARLKTPLNKVGGLVHDKGKDSKHSGKRLADKLRGTKLGQAAIAKGVGKVWTRVKRSAKV